MPPKKTDSTKVNPSISLGVRGTSIHGGYIDEKERDSRLTGTDKYKTYSNILANTTIVAAGIRYYLNLVAKAGWKVLPADESEEAGAYASRVNTLLFDDSMETPWPRIVRRTAMFRFYGFSIQEWIAEQKPSGDIGFFAIEPRPQITIERWDVDSSGRVLGCWQRSPQDYLERYLPIRKCVYVVDDSLNDSPEGLGLLRHVAEADRRLKLYERLEGQGFEGDLRGIPIGRAPLAYLDTYKDPVTGATLTDTQKVELLQPLKDFLTDHIRSANLGMLLDSLTYSSVDEAGNPSNVRQWDVELLYHSGSSQDSIRTAITDLHREIARVLGVEHLLLGGESRGSHALSKDKSHNFYLIIDSALTELAAVYRRHLLVPIWELNGWPLEYLPKLKAEAVQFRDIEQITGALRDMAQAGSILAPDDPAIVEVRTLMGISSPETIVDMEDAAIPHGDKEKEEEGEEEEEGGE